MLVPREVECKRVTFKYGLGDEFIEVLKTLHKLGLDSTKPVTVRGVEVRSARRRRRGASRPGDARRPDARQDLRGNVRHRHREGRRTRGATYLYHVSDNEETMREYGSQAVVWQTAINPVVAMELLANGAWSGAGVLGPEAFDAVPFLDLLGAYGEAHGQLELA